MTDERFENPYLNKNEGNSEAIRNQENPEAFDASDFTVASAKQDEPDFSNQTVTEPVIDAVNPKNAFDAVKPEETAEQPFVAVNEPTQAESVNNQIPHIPMTNNVSQAYGAPRSEVENFSRTSGSSQPQQPICPQSPYSYEWYGGNPRATYNNPAPQPQKQAKSKTGVSKGMFFGGIALCLCLSFVFGFAGTWAYNNLGSGNRISNSNGVTINQVESQSGSSDAFDGGLSTVEIVNKAADSVVEITTETVKTGVFAQQYIDSGAGSGVIIDAKGIIVTNHHVIDGATKISVSLRDGTSYNATLLGSDAELDVALLEITPDKTLTAATFGDSSNLMVGQRTVAIGNPLGQLGGSVTEGIISALNRDVVIDGQTMSLLQTDTAINPGNSGGGLFDSNGNLIGIVNAKSSGSEIEGLGFAIPINDVIDVIGDLSEYGYVRGRVDLGITFIDVESEQVAWMYRLDEIGCYIYSVEENRNADKAGLASGDRVISVNGTEVENSDDVEAIIKNCSVGEEVTFEVKSTSGKTHKVSFELEEYVPEKKNENFFDNNGSLDDYSYWWSYYE